MAQYDDLVAWFEDNPPPVPVCAHGFTEEQSCDDCERML
jgi:hypothetical protein